MRKSDYSFPSQILRDSEIPHSFFVMTMIIIIIITIIIIIVTNFSNGSSGNIKTKFCGKLR